MDVQEQEPETHAEPTAVPPVTYVEPDTRPTNYVAPPPLLAPKPVHNNGKNIIIALLVVLLLAALGAVAYLLMNEPKEVAVQSVDTSQTDTETVEQNEVKPTRFTSKLWPDLSFDVPVGWTASEPADYNPSNPAGAKFADGKITISSGDTTLALTLGTVRVTGIVGTPCYTKQNLQNIKDDIYRFTENGKLVIQPGYTAASNDWQEIIAYDSTMYEPGNNYCQKGWPVVGLYESTIKQSDSPNFPYGYNGNTHVMAHASAEATGDLSDAKIADIDSIIKSLSDSTAIAPMS